MNPDLLEQVEVGDEIEIEGGPLLGLDPSEPLVLHCVQSSSTGAKQFEAWYFGIFLMEIGLKDLNGRLRCIPFLDV
jgi:hypothetical protein